jgi:hypothetical protein
VWKCVQKPLCATGLSIICFGLLAGETIAGPPFRTDDPVPVAFGHYELYTAAIGTHLKGDTSGALPGVELTYGLIPNGQLQIGVRRPSIVLPMAQRDSATAIPN